MANESRTKHSKRNIISGILRQIIGIVLTFAVRTVLLYSLGAEYQGLNGLFTSVLQVLNLTDLGFSTAVIFVLYKPVADNDIDAICSITNFLRKVYLVIGFTIMAAGLVLMPFLPYLIKGSYPNDINIFLLFAIYLINSVVSYLMFAYKNAVLSAMQRDDIVSKIHIVSSSLIKVTQIVLLMMFRNYYVFIVVLPLGTVINNLLLQYISKKFYPQIVPRGKITPEIKSVLTKQIKAIFFGKASDVARNSFDNVVISMFLGLTTIAIYDNYYYIYSSIYGFMILIMHAIQASVGNSIVKESVDKNYDDMQLFTFIFMVLVGFCSICLACLYQPFMIIWMNGDSSMLLSIPNMLLFCLYFYAINMTNTMSLYLDGNGLFWECRVWYVLEALGNLALNFLLGFFFGVTGILVATIITIFVFNFLARTRILYKCYFKKSKKEFYKYHCLYFAVTVFVGFMTYCLCLLIPYDNYLGLFVKALICVAVPLLLFTAIYFRIPFFSKSMRLFKRGIKTK